MVDFSYPLAYVFILFIVLFYRYIAKYIGGADLLIFALLYSRYGYESTLRIIMFSCIFALMYSLIKGKESIRFIPFILVSLIIYV